MNILFDFITLSLKTGAGEYHRRVFFEMINHITQKNLYDRNVYVLYDSQKGIAYSDMQEECLSKLHNTTFVDVSNNRISEIICNYKIDKFFIACAQYLQSYETLMDIKCEVICVVHDLLYQELTSNHIYGYMHLLQSDFESTKKSKISIVEKLRFKRYAYKFGLWFYQNINYPIHKKDVGDFLNIISLIKKNPKSSIITVSESTKYSLMYNYDIPSEKVEVLYSPERLYSKEKKEIENPVLKKLIQSNLKYFLYVSANRDTKNPQKTIDAFKRYSHYCPNMYLLVLNHKGDYNTNIIGVDYLNDSDLLHAYKHCYALIYPSFFEGFGYPPIEAMHYSKPVIASNTTSIPEVLGDAPIYFSPFYLSNIFKGLMELNDKNYDSFCLKSRSQYLKVQERQEKDLSKLIDLILL